MKATPFEIRIEEEVHFPPGIDLLFHHEVLAKWNLPPGTSLPIRLGLKREIGNIGGETHKKGLLRMRKRFANRLLLPFPVKIYGWLTPEKEILFGPTFGILLSGVKGEKEDPFGLYTRFCEEAWALSRSFNVLCYVIPFRSLTVKENRVEGWVKEKEGWRPYPMPIPAILYNRLSVRSQERSPLFSSLQQSLREKNGILFNDKFLNKWEVVELLQGEVDLLPYLPLSLPAVKLSMIKEMLSHTSVLFLKPLHGSEGTGIIRVRKTGDGYFTDEMIGELMETKFYTTLPSLLHSLRQKIKRKRYLLQKGIPLLEVERRTTDFRALVQKGRNGEWKVVSLVARIGKPGAFVSNVAQGGRMERASHILSELRERHPTLPTIHKLKAIAREVARRLDGKLSGYYGEFGIDLGVSQTGEVWLIEVNSKPSKKEEAILNPVSGPRPSVQHLFDTLFYYLHFSLHQKEGGKGVG
ncbi:MAG: YheC/YheD family protein [Thermicanus sp.]|nr:YheC/YheD family protein [Thermicanus sp.]